MEYADEETILVSYALHLGMPYIPLDQLPKRKQLARILPSKLAYKHTIIPIDTAIKTLVVASPEPLSEDERLDIEKETGRRIMVTLAKRRDLEDGLGEYYEDELSSGNRSEDQSSANEEAAVNA